MLVYLAQTDEGGPLVHLVHSPGTTSETLTSIIISNFIVKNKDNKGLESKVYFIL